MAKIEGLSKVQAAIRERAKPGPGRVSVAVGYTAKYGLYVHENIGANFKVGQAKFLEEPARLLGPELGAMIREAMKAGQPMLEALMLAGLRLQRESMLLCPIDTGNLRASAFTRPENGENQGT